MPGRKRNTPPIQNLKESSAKIQRNTNNTVTRSSNEDKYGEIQALIPDASMKELEWIREVINYENPEGMNCLDLLVKAVMKGHIKAVGYLIEKGIPVNVPLTILGTPTLLHLAATKGYSEVISHLIRADAVVDQTDNEGATSLYIAARHGKTESVKALLQAGANPNQAANHGVTPLLIATQRGHTECVKALIQNGADINQTNNFGSTALVIAAGTGQSELILLLIRAGAMIDQTDHEGETSLYIAARQGKTESVKALLQAGANPNQAANNGVTPLIIATQMERTECAMALTQAGADINQTNNFGSTALIIAVETGQSELIPLLIRDGAVINQTDHKGTTLLYIAAGKGNTECVKALLQAGANPNQAANNGVTPLLIATQMGHTGCVMALIRARADINQTNNFGSTALIIAAEMGQTECARALIQAGANINQKQLNNSCTALYVAVHYNNANVVSLLLASGAKIITKHKLEMLNALELAHERQNKSVIDAFFNSGVYFNEDLREVREKITQARAESNKAIYEDRAQKLGLLGMAYNDMEEDWGFVQARYIWEDQGDCVPMPIGYTYTGKYYLSQALEGEENSLSWLNSNSSEALTLWFSGLVESGPKALFPLSKILVSYRFKQATGFNINLSEQNELNLLKGDQTAWSQITGEYPDDIFRQWLDAMIEAPENRLYQGHYSALKCNLRVFQLENQLARAQNNPSVQTSPPVGRSQQSIRSFFKPIANDSTIEYSAASSSRGNGPG